MKRVVIILTIISCQMMSYMVQAKENCQEESESLGAIYTIKNLHINANKTNYSTQKTTQQDKQQETIFELWRKDNELLHITPAKEMTIKWHKLINNDVRKVSYFDHYQRGIEFEPQSLSNNNWQLKKQLVTDEQIAKMTLLTAEGKGCELIEHYQFEDKGISMELWWYPALKLAQKIIYVETNNSTIWLLGKKIFSNTEIVSVFNKADKYQMTDYADIGDNESDPFLRKMIHLGFVAHGNSGFYDAQGNQLSGKHHH